MWLEYYNESMTTTKMKYYQFWDSWTCSTLNKEVFRSWTRTRNNHSAHTVKALALLIPSGRGGLVYGLIWHQVTSDLAYFGLTWRGRWVNEWVSECQCVWVTTMIKIISYVVVAFCYRKANILRRWSNILHIFYGNKGLCHGCRSYWFGWKLALLHAAFEQLQY